MEAFLKLYGHVASTIRSVVNCTTDSNPTTIEMKRFDVALRGIEPELKHCYVEYVLLPFFLYCSLKILYYYFLLTKL